MKKTKEVFHLLYKNWRIVVLFEVLYKLSATVLFLPVCWWIFNVIMWVQGYAYLTVENIARFFCNPITIGMLLILLAFMTFLTMLDIGAIIFIIDQSAQDKKVHLLQVFKYTLRNALRVLKKGNILLPVFVLFMIPFLNLGVASSMVGTISVPEFIWEYITQRKPLLVLFVLGTVVLAVLLLRWIFAFHYFTLERCGFREARRKSAALVKGRRMITAAVLLAVQLLTFLIYHAALALGILCVVTVEKLFSKYFLLDIGVSAVIWVLLSILIMVLTALGTPISYSTISILFYEWKQEKREDAVYSLAPVYRESEQRKKVLHRCYAVFAGVLMLVSTILVYGFYTGRLNPQIEYIRTMEVTAHRGASADYPENTMAAFQGAKDQGADWIELDVQQSSDGQIFVMHDTNFKRTTGVNERTWELTYGQISKLDAGSFFSKEYAGERIPLLSEVIAFAKENQIRLNIELKPTGHETAFEKQVTDIIREEEFEDRCVITSQVYQVLERVKEYDEEIQTVYVMSLAYGNVNRLTAADNFSIEASSVTDALVTRVHNAGKQLYAWTVNTRSRMERMIELNVDNIITDNIVLAKECVYNSKFSTIVDEYIKFLG